MMSRRVLGCDANGAWVEKDKTVSFKSIMIGKIINNPDVTQFEGKYDFLIMQNSEFDECDFEVILLDESNEELKQIMTNFVHYYPEISEGATVDGIHAKFKIVRVPENLVDNNEEIIANLFCGDERNLTILFDILSTEFYEV